MDFIVLSERFNCLNCLASSLIVGRDTPLPVGRSSPASLSATSTLLLAIPFSASSRSEFTLLYGVSSSMGSSSAGGSWVEFWCALKRLYGPWSSLFSSTVVLLERFGCFSVCLSTLACFLFRLRDS